MTAPDTLLRLPQVLAVVPFSKATLYRRIKDGSFPAPLQMSERCVAWRSSQIAEWQDARYQGIGGGER